MSGAGARPDAKYTLKKIRQGDTAAGDAELDHHPVMGSGELNWLQFLLIMTAHGWFLRPGLPPIERQLKRYCDA